MSITLPASSTAGPIARILQEANIATFRAGSVQDSGPLLEITFDNNRRGESISARPILPLTLKY